MVGFEFNFVSIVLNYESDEDFFGFFRIYCVEFDGNVNVDEVIE